jgi:hypothetical protein
MCPLLYAVPLVPALTYPRSLELLYALGALNSKGALTEEVGAPLSRLPVDPMYGKVLLAAASMGCTVEAMQVRQGEGEGANRRWNDRCEPALEAAAGLCCSSSSHGWPPSCQFHSGH